jgi:hypothetical protein
MRLHRRRPDGSWLVVSVDKAEDVLDLPSIGSRFAPADIYEEVEF